MVSVLMAKSHRFLLLVILVHSAIAAVADAVLVLAAVIPVLKFFFIRINMFVSLKRFIQSKLSVGVLLNVCLKKGEGYNLIEFTTILPIR